MFRLKVLFPSTPVGACWWWIYFKCGGMTTLHKNINQVLIMQIYLLCKYHTIVTLQVSQDSVQSICFAGMWKSWMYMYCISEKKYKRKKKVIPSPQREQCCLAISTELLANVCRFKRFYFYYMSKMQCNMINFSDKNEWVMHLFSKFVPCAWHGHWYTISFIM